MAEKGAPLFVRYLSIFAPLHLRSANATAFPPFSISTLPFSALHKVL